VGVIGNKDLNNKLNLTIRISSENADKEPPALFNGKLDMKILKNLNRTGIIRMIDYGDAGQVLKHSGRVIDSLVFIVMELVQGGLLFDLCLTMVAVGEDAGHLFLMQMVEAIEYMHTCRVVQGDLKLESILTDDKLNLKITDFGFACYKSIDSLKSCRGTMTYLAPEIKKGKVHKGTQVDLLSVGIILFINVQGIFPAKKARKEEYFYNSLLTGQIDTYFTKVNGHALSPEFKSLILSFFACEGDKRPTLE
jgi:serine/threonine protein kinase